ncbi:MAG TPA: TIGR02302 family protein [Alphaproteobacteria bacterium]|nr:TIGR02302 family protein [Alphaproteobacteria bacterium]
MTQGTGPYGPDLGASWREPYGRRLTLARLALAWERAWPALWPVLGVAGVFLALALFDVLPRLPGWLHVAVLAALAAGLLFALYRGRRAFRIPDSLTGRRRLEMASGFVHRPLATLDDRLAGGANDPVAKELWRAHRHRLIAALSKVRVGWPAPGLAKRDPWAIRAALMLVLVVGATVAGPAAWTRIERALSPSVAGAAAPPGLLDLWITPPNYTGLPPLLPHAVLGQAPEIAVPVGSQLLAQVSGGYGTPKLAIDGKSTAFSAVDAKSYRVSAAISSGTKLAVEQGGASLGAWTMRIIPDHAPTAELPQAPARTHRAALRISFEAHDDYGLTSVVANILRADAPAGVDNTPIELVLPLAGGRTKEAKGQSFHDLTAHPWAGLPVLLTIRATDALGQVGMSDAFAMVLPERVFQHPVARAIVEQRKALVADPSTRTVVSRALMAIAGVPAQYFDDTVVFLALKISSARLLKDATADTVNGVQQLLWDTALRIEDGRLSHAERELRALQQRLQDALANNATDAEIEKMIRELQEAIDKFLQAMMEQAMRQPQDRQMPLDRNSMRIERLDLQRMLDQARQLARTGARDAAREMLSRLQEMLENLRAGTMMANPQPGGSEAQQMMRGLQEMMQRQQGLTDRSFRRSQRARPGQQGQRGQQQMPGQQGQQGQQGGEGDDVGDSAEQDALRRSLGEFMRRMGEQFGNIPDAFGRAERSMRDAAEALSRGAPGRALRPQMDALENLRAGARELGQQLAERFGQDPGEDGASETDPHSAQNRDPLGRPLSGLGGLDGRDVGIPEEAELQRSREILDELLRRAGERFRPLLERDYIERLLKRF